VSYLQALAVPALALLGVAIAALQMRIANDKLQHDIFEKLYDRRLAVYEATRKLLIDIFHDVASDSQIISYKIITVDASFIFEDELQKYLKETCDRVAKWNHAKNSALRALPGDERDIYLNLMNEQLSWIIYQGEEISGFTARFLPYLKYKPIKRPWLMRWLF